MLFTLTYFILCHHFPCVSLSAADQVVMVSRAELPEGEESDPIPSEVTSGQDEADGIPILVNIKSDDVCVCDLA